MKNDTEEIENVRRLRQLKDQHLTQKLTPGDFEEFKGGCVITDNGDY